MNRGLCIAWTCNPERCTEIAQALNFDSLILPGSKKLNVRRKLLQYIKNLYTTVRVLRERSGSFIVVQVPPWPAFWAVSMVVGLDNCVVDAHPSAFGHFNDRVSKVLLTLTPKKLIKIPRLFLVANTEDLRRLQNIGVKAVMIFGEAITEIPQSNREKSNRILVPFSGNSDEPIFEFIDFLQGYKGTAQFLLTGNFSAPLNQRLKPFEDSGQIELVGYLEPEEFRVKLANSLVVLCLSNSPVTRMRVAIEATLCECVVIVSKNENMIDELPYALFVDGNLANLESQIDEAFRTPKSKITDAQKALREKNRLRIENLSAMLDEVL